MDARSAISNRPCGLFFVRLSNLHSILFEHKARDDNIITLLLPWPCKQESNERQTHMCKYFLSAPKNSPSAERWSEHF